MILIILLLIMMAAILLAYVMCPPIGLYIYDYIENFIHKYIKRR